MSKDRNLLLLSTLKDLASMQVNSDNSDFNAFNYASGNWDDCYEMGKNDGEILLARHLLELVNKS